jgi:hypothetical protein
MNTAEVNPAWEAQVKKVLEDILNNCSNLSLEDLETLRILSEKKLYE